MQRLDDATITAWVTAKKAGMTIEAIAMASNVSPITVQRELARSASRGDEAVDLITVPTDGGLYATLESARGQTSLSAFIRTLLETAPGNLASLESPVVGITTKPRVSLRLPCRVINKIRGNLPTGMKFGEALRRILWHGLSKIGSEINPRTIPVRVVRTRKHSPPPVREAEPAALQDRDYQRRVIAKTIGFFEAGDSTVLLESPTGSGKTIMALSICKYFEDRYGWRTNWVAMRRNLLQQVSDANAKFFGMKKLQTVSMFAQDPPEAEITVVDEAQHDAVDSAVNIHKKSHSKVILGLTATPFRTDLLKLAFKRQVKDAGIHRLIAEGWLCQYHHYTMDDAWSPEAVASIYLRDKEKWGKSIAFFSTIDECQQFAALLAEDGVHCEVVTATTNREEQLEQFDAGRFEIIANVAILNEGFDCPSLRTVFVRDGSKLPTIQMAGRAFRLHDAKPHANIVQTKYTRWSFIRTARPQRSFMEIEGKWLAFSNSEVLDTAIQETIDMLTTADPAPLPQFIVEHQRRQQHARRFGRTRRLGNRVRRQTLVRRAS